MLSGMESFVVRIHRRPEASAPSEVVGIVEAVHSGVGRPFCGIAELLALLGLDRRCPPPKTHEEQPA
jgi:hypothetical protein